MAIQVLEMEVYQIYKMNSLIIKAMTAVMLSLVSTSASAARYELKSGGHNAVCRDYVTALNAIKRELPMACERHFSESFTKFRKPEWQRLNPKDLPMTFYKDIHDVMEHALFIKDRDPEKTWPYFKEFVVGPGFEQGLIELAKAHIDIDGDSRVEVVIRMRRLPGGCEAETKEWFIGGPDESPGKYWSSPRGFRYFVISNVTGRVDPDYGYPSLARADDDIFL